MTLFLSLFLSVISQDQYDVEIREIAARPKVREAFEIIVALEPQTERDLIHLTEIPAPPFMEDKRAARYAEMLREAGLESVTTDEVGNVLGEITGAEGGRTVAVVAHLDTVFPEGTDVTVRREGDRLHAPGIGDDTRGLVLVLTLVRALTRAEVKTKSNLLIVGSVGEEGLGDLRGVKHLFREGGPRIDEFIAVDGGSTERVLNHAIGSHRYRLTFKGPGGHSWGAFGLANPAHALARAIHFFDEEAAEFVISGPRTSYNIGRIGGGTSVNAIPFENWAEVDMRSEDPDQLEKIDAIFQRAVTRALEEQNERRRRGDPLTVEIQPVGDRPSGKVDPDTPLIQRALAATRFFGVEPELGSGSTDANVPIALGIPATTIGRGGAGEGAHSLHEWWSNEDGHIDIQKALLLVVASAGLAE
ncbi:MAG TPA: M20/M25/M40 family metallo-hydrolase [Vicinamibacteria bacterium]|nr:M20/M25/M40 family metallo-hydrolase [Vicinamibacteria bacterium]